MNNPRPTPKIHYPLSADNMELEFEPIILPYPPTTETKAEPKPMATGNEQYCYICGLPFRVAPDIIEGTEFVKKPYFIAFHKECRKFLK